MAAISESHSRAADSTSVSSTACRLNAERLITQGNRVKKFVTKQ
jgi:hypothetical protein